MTREKEYVKSLTADKEYFKISLKEAREFVKNSIEVFKDDVKVSVWDAAIDYSFPVIIVKQLKKEVF